MKQKRHFIRGNPNQKKNNAWEVFLIHQFSRIGNNSYWIFPKGHPEGVETPEQTALRELKRRNRNASRKFDKKQSLYPKL